MSLESLLAGVAMAPMVTSFAGDGHAGPMVRIFDVARMGLSPYFLAALYFVLAVYSAVQLRKIHHLIGGGFDTQKMLHAFTSTFCWLRALSFGVLSVFVALDAGAWYPVVVILFTVPDYLCLGTYVLICCQWLEVYVFAHDQFIIESRRSFRRQWVVGFFTLTLALYVGLSILYILLLMRTEEVADSVVQAILYTTAFGSLALPTAALAVCGYFSLLLLSGFSFSSEMAQQRVRNTNRVFGIWTFGRIVSKNTRARADWRREKYGRCGSFSTRLTLHLPHLPPPPPPPLALASLAASSSC